MIEYDITDCDLDGDREEIHWCASCGDYEVSAEGQECAECYPLNGSDWGADWDADHAMEMEDGR